MYGVVHRCSAENISHLGMKEILIQPKHMGNIGQSYSSMKTPQHCNLEAYDPFYVLAHPGTYSTSSNIYLYFGLKAVFEDTQHALPWLC